VGERTNGIGGMQRTLWGGLNTGFDSRMMPGMHGGMMGAAITQQLIGHTLPPVMFLVVPF
jgi:hypothetical protein